MSSDFYNWRKTMSYDADVSLVIGPRGRGKTYGLRLQCMKDFMKDGYTFVEIVRYKETLKSVEPNYFSRIEAIYTDYEFKVQSHTGYARKKGTKEWNVLVYFVALSSSQMLKLSTFYKVKRMIFDEFTLALESTQYLRYLKNEFDALANLVDTVTRQRSGDNQKPKLYLLGNALDAANPVFYRYGIYDPAPGYTWYEGKTVVLHYVQDDEYSTAKENDTVAGRMLRGTVGGRTAIYNEFAGGKNEYISKRKPAKSFVLCTIVFRRHNLRVWVSFDAGLSYVDECPDLSKEKKPVYYLLHEDGTPDRMAITKVSQLSKTLMSMFSHGLTKFSDVFVQKLYIDMLQQFGLK